jgi:hypothetical protein
LWASIVDMHDSFRPQCSHLLYKLSAFSFVIN